MTYKLSPDATSRERVQAAEELQQDLTKALQLFLGTRPVESVEPVLSPVEQLEEYLLDPNAGRRAIRLIETEADKLADLLDAISLSEMAKDESVDGIYKLIQVYESQTADLLDVFVRASYEADPLITDALVKALYRIAHIERLPHRVGNPHLYPALLLLYGGGIAALAGNKVATLISLIRDVRISDGSKTYPAAYQLVPYRVLPETVAKQVPPVKAHYVPISDLLFDALREPLRRVIKVDRQYYEYFLRFEYLFALASASASQEFGLGGVHAPVGSYLWERTLRERPYILEVTDEELKRQKEAWPPFKEGIYDGTYEEFLLFKQQVDESIKGLVALFYS